MVHSSIIPVWGRGGGVLPYLLQLNLQCFLKFREYCVSISCWHSLMNLLLARSTCIEQSTKTLSLKECSLWNLKVDILSEMMTLWPPQDPPLSTQRVRWWRYCLSSCPWRWCDFFPFLDLCSLNLHEYKCSSNIWFSAQLFVHSFPHWTFINHCKLPSNWACRWINVKVRWTTSVWLDRQWSLGI